MLLRDEQRRTGIVLCNALTQRTENIFFFCLWRGGTLPEQEERDNLDEFG